MKANPAILNNKTELIALFIKHKNIINEFYNIDRVINTEELLKIAITGSTYRAFHRKDKKSPGMSIYFKKIASENSDKNPAYFINSEQFINDLSKSINGKFKNIYDNNGRVKLLKLFNLYANYWIALNTSLKKEKCNSIKLLKVPLDKYSLTFIRNLYNETEFLDEYKLLGNLSMGSIKDIDHYNRINKYIENLSKEISQEIKEEFYPVYIDLLQAGANNLNWYEINIERFKK